MTVPKRVHMVVGIPPSSPELGWVPIWRATSCGSVSWLPQTVTWVTPGGTPAAWCSWLYTSRTEMNPSVSRTNSPSFRRCDVSGEVDSVTMVGASYTLMTLIAMQSPVATQVCPSNVDGGVNSSRPTTSTTELGGSIITVMRGPIQPGQQ